MPTVLLVDVSLSMARCAVPGESEGAVVTRLDVAKAGLKRFIEHLAANLPCEFCALLTFSSQCTTVMDFTNGQDYVTMLDLVDKLGFQDKTCVDDALKAVKSAVQNHFGSDTACQIVLFTELPVSIAPQAVLACPYKLHVVGIGPPSAQAEANVSATSLEANSTTTRFIHDLFAIDPAAPGSVAAAIDTMVAAHFLPYNGTLRCGLLSSPISLHPAPSALAGLELTADVQLPETLIILGFMSHAALASPPVCSRHVLLPSGLKGIPLALDQADFRTLLHGGLKMADSVALVRLGPDWYGFVHSWTELKKSNVMLSTMPPGFVVPWLGPLTDLTLGSALDTDTAFSYSEDSRDLQVRTDSGLQTDIQKLLRLVRNAQVKKTSALQHARALRDGLLATGMWAVHEQVAMHRARRLIEQVRKLLKDAQESLVRAGSTGAAAAALDIVKEWEKGA